MNPSVHKYRGNFLCKIFYEKTIVFVITLVYNDDMSKRQSCGFCRAVLGIGAGVFVAALFGNGLASAVTYQDSVDVSFTFNPTISVDLSTSDLIISELTPGTTSDSNAVTITVSTNTAYGYYLTATAGTSSTSSDLVNSSNNTYKFSSIATNADLATLATDNTWGYRTSSDNGTTWSNYSGLPKDNNDNGETGKALIETNTPADSKTVKFKIGAKASTDQAAGTYTNTINFYAVAYAAPEPSSAPGECTDTATCMQTMTSCSTTAADVTDARDGTIYKVQQLADGNCWMLDNLALDPTQLTQAELYGTAEQPLTNASNTTLGYLKNGGGTTSDKYAITGVVEWTDSPTYASGYSYSDPLIATSYKDTINPNTSLNYGNGSHKYGIYYNYCAASAGSYCYGNGTSAGTSSGNATEDLCPAGWRMPTGGSSGEYSSLYGYYNTTQTATDTASLQYNLSTPLSGYFYSGSANDRGTDGNFWSSTRYSDYSMYGLHVNSGNVYPTNRYSRYFGVSMRCLLDS